MESSDQSAFNTSAHWSVNSHKTCRSNKIKAPIPRLQISIRIAYPDKKWNKLNNVGAIHVVRIRINFVRKGVPIKSLSEPFYPDADDIWTAFSKIRRQKDINLKIFSDINKMYEHPNIIKNGQHYLSCYFVLN